MNINTLNFKGNLNNSQKIWNENVFKNEANQGEDTTGEIYLKDIIQQIVSLCTFCQILDQHLGLYGSISL